MNKLAKGDTFLLFGETFWHNRITKTAFIGLSILIILFLAAVYGFLLWEAQYLFPILEEIVYCDKEMTEQDIENSDRQLKAG